MSELLPCPFCGGEAVLIRDEPAAGFCFVECSCCCACGACSPITSEQAAIEAWNTRAERTCHETEIDKFFRGCDSCGWVWEVFYVIGKRERPRYCPNCGAKVVER